MKKPIKIEEEDLLKLHKVMGEKDAYIKKLEKALESVKRQLKNLKEQQNVKA